jgi:hypothetical protein
VITSFTGCCSGEKVSACKLFASSSGRQGVCGSQEKDMIRVILDERNAEKQQHGDNFTWISQKCEVMNSKKELKEKVKLPGESGG